MILESLHICFHSTLMLRRPLFPNFILWMRSFFFLPHRRVQKLESINSWRVDRCLTHINHPFWWKPFFVCQGEVGLYVLRLGSIDRVIAVPTILPFSFHFLFSLFKQIFLSPPLSCVWIIDYKFLFFLLSFDCLSPLSSPLLLCHRFGFVLLS